MKDTKSCFNCSRNLDYLNKGGFANCGMFERVGVSRNTNPTSANICEYYKEKVFEEMEKDLSRLHQSSEEPMQDEEDIDVSDGCTYRYAHNENNEIVDILKIDVDYRKQHKFYCIGCGKEMSAHLKDDKRRRHFHHIDGCACSSESYIHMLSKEMFMKAYENASKFYLYHSIIEKCDAKGCVFRQNSCDTHKTSKSIQLKEYFPVCALEKDVKGKDGNTYRADILLSNPQKQNHKLLVEIRVSHECTDEKKQSGLHIVEISVNSEEEAIKLGSINSLKEGGNIVLFQFNKKYSKKLENTIYRYAHIPNVKTLVKEISCSQQGQALFEEADVEIDFLKEDDFDIKNIENYFNIRYSLNVPNCNTCSHLKILGTIRKCNICNLDELARFSCDNYQKIDDDYEYGFPQEKYKFVKGNVRNDCKIFVHGPHAFFNDNVIYEAIKEYVQRYQGTHNVVLVGSDNINFSAGINSASERLNVYFEITKIDWERYDKRAPYEFVYKVINDDSINAVIVFTNGEDNVCNKAVELATAQNKLLCNFDLRSLEKICPRCGSMLIPRNGRYGMFWGCGNYPECDYNAPKR